VDMLVTVLVMQIIIILVHQGEVVTDEAVAMIVIVIVMVRVVNPFYSINPYKQILPDRRGRQSDTGPYGRDDRRRRDYDRDDRGRRDDYRREPPREVDPFGRDVRRGDDFEEDAEKLGLKRYRDDYDDYYDYDREPKRPKYYDYDDSPRGMY